MASVNPFRYRGYYYDTETGFYYLQSRYYNPEIGRFINTDSINVIGATPTALTDKNLYAYCSNNPVMFVDPTGHVPEWLKWVAVGIGAALTIAAITVLTCGVGTATLTGAVMVGAAKETLIGAAVGVIGGGAIGYAIDGKDGMFTGAALGFGCGAVIGAIAGGISGAISYVPPNTFKPYPTNQFGVDPSSLISQRSTLSTKKLAKNLFETISKHGKIDRPILVNRQGMIIDGHHRVAVAKWLKQTVNIVIG